MTAPTADNLRTNRIGASRLQSYEARSIDGSDVSYPSGVDAQRIISYMPAQLVRSDRRRFSDDTQPAADDELAAASGYPTYARPYSLVGDGPIAHHVAIRPNRERKTSNAARPH